MDLAHQLCDGRGGAGIAHAPARHRKRLGEAVERDGALEHAGHGRKGCVRAAAVGQLGVDLVGDDHDVGALEYPCDCLEVCALHDAAGGVVGVGQDQRLGARRDGGGQLPGQHAEGDRRVGGDAHGHAAGQPYARHVGDVGGLGDEHLIARLDQRAQRKVDALGRAHGDNDLLFGVVGQAAAVKKIARDFAAQLQRAPVGGVVRLPLLDGVDGGLADVPGRDKVRLAHAQGDGVLHRGHDVEELADAAGWDVRHRAVDDGIVIHGDTASLPSA